MQEREVRTTITKKKRQEQEHPTPRRKRTEQSTILDLSQGIPLEAKATVRGGRTISIVNTSKNGKRVVLSKKLVEELGSPKSIQFLQLKGKLIIGENLDDSEKFKFSKTLTCTIYNSSLVNALTKTLGLDFADVTSQTINKIRIKEATNANGDIVMVAVIRINQ